MSSAQNVAGIASTALIVISLIYSLASKFTRLKRPAPNTLRMATSRERCSALTALQNRAVVAVGSSQPQVFDARLICATNDNLLQKVQSGEFRQDLLYRINTIEITLPPLRQRREDIPLLLNWYLQHYSAKYQQTGVRISAGDLKLLGQYDWPGNVRQLAHAVERAVVLAEDGVADFSQLFSVTSSENTRNDNLCREEQDFTLDYVEQKTIAQALQFFQGNISQAAKALGLTRAALYRRMEKYQL